MNWDAIAAVGDLVAAVAVVVTLVYLGRQFAATLRQQRMDSQRAVSEEFNRINDLWLDLDVTGALVRAWSDWEGATAQEKHIAGVFFMKVMNHLQTMFLMWESGTLDDSVYFGEEHLTCAFLVTDGGKNWWAVFQEGHAARFKDRVNLKLAERENVPITELVPYWDRRHWQADR